MFIAAILAASVWMSLLCFPPLAAAQTRGAATETPGSISGITYFEGRLVIPFAEILIVNRTSGRTFTTKSDETGNFAFLQLPAGDYSLTAWQFGFQTTLIRELSVRSGQNIPLSLVIKLDGWNSDTITEFADVRITGPTLNSVTLEGPARDATDFTQTFYNTIVLNSLNGLAATGFPQVLVTSRPPKVMTPARHDPTNTQPSAPSSHALPLYPQSARDQGIGGTVELTGKIGADGRIGSVRVTSSSNPIFEGSALDAVGRWTYRPMEQYNRAVESTATITVRFEFVR